MKRNMLVPLLAVALGLTACSSKTYVQRCPSWSELTGDCSIFLDYSYNQTNHSFDLDPAAMVRFDMIGDAVITDPINMAFSHDGAPVDAVTERIYGGTYIARPVDTTKPSSFALNGTGGTSGVSFEINFETVSPNP